MPLWKRMLRVSCKALGFLHVSWGRWSLSAQHWWGYAWPTVCSSGIHNTAETWSYQKSLNEVPYNWVTAWSIFPMRKVRAGTVQSREEKSQGCSHQCKKMQRTRLFWVTGREMSKTDISFWMSGSTSLLCRTLKNEKVCHTVCGLSLSGDSCPRQSALGCPRWVEGFGQMTSRSNIPWVCEWLGLQKLL